MRTLYQLGAILTWLAAGIFTGRGCHWLYDCAYRTTLVSEQHAICTIFFGVILYILGLSIYESAPLKRKAGK